ncbi:hypothetical protein ACJX0J_029762, partial [Zea mays]
MPLVTISINLTKIYKFFFGAGAAACRITKENMQICQLFLLTIINFRLCALLAHRIVFYAAHIDYINFRSYFREYMLQTKHPAPSIRLQRANEIHRFYGIISTLHFVPFLKGKEIVMWIKVFLVCLVNTNVVDVIVGGARGLRALHLTNGC